MAAEVMDVMARLTGCAGQAADAVSALSHVEMEDASTLLKLPKSALYRRMDTSTTTQVAQIVIQYRRPSGSS